MTTEMGRHEKKMLRELRDGIIRHDLNQDQLVSLLTDNGGPPSDREVRTAMETSYRRGFVQGVAACVRAAEEGYSVDKMNDWLCMLQLRWRTKKHHGEMEPPKELLRKNGRRREMVKA